jgi:hypothetical protein
VNLNNINFVMIKISFSLLASLVAAQAYIPSAEPAVKPSTETSSSTDSSSSSSDIVDLDNIAKLSCYLVSDF